MLTDHDISNLLNLGTTKTRDVLLQAVDLFHQHSDFAMPTSVRSTGLAER